MSNTIREIASLPEDQRFPVLFGKFAAVVMEAKKLGMNYSIKQRTEEYCRDICALIQVTGNNHITAADLQSFDEFINLAQDIPFFKPYINVIQVQLNKNYQR